MFIQIELSEEERDFFFVNICVHTLYEYRNKTTK